ncbi:MAG: PAS domain S-box protein, partial [Myxococcota bacterium]
MEDRDTPIDDVPLVSKQVVRGADRLTAVPREVARQLEMLEAVARRTGNAVIVTDPRGRIEWVNEGFRRLTGYEASDALGHRPAELLQGPDTSVEVRRQMGAAISAGRPFDVVVLNYKKTGEQYWVHIEAEPTRDATGSLNGYIALETDVTERRIAEGREDLAKRISDGLLQATCVEEACRIITTELVGTLDVRTAQAWTVEPGSPTLRYVTGARADEAGQGWLDVSSSREFRRGTEWVVGVGAPGVAWGTGLPCVKVDFWEQDNNGQYSRRAEAARLGGIRTVLAAPVKGPDGVVAVLEVGGSHRYPGHDRLPALLEYVARQLAAFLARHESRTAFEALFQSSPDALLVLDDQGVVTAANRRAEEMFQEVNGRSIM